MATEANYKQNCIAVYRSSVPKATGNVKDAMVKMYMANMVYAPPCL